MGLSLSLFIFMPLLLLLSQFHLILANSQPLCHHDDSSALLEFKESFVINKSASPYDPSAYPKVASWRVEGDKSDCCSWDGVECDEDSGYVIGLDLSNSLLYGSINSSSSLFRLVHLQRLDLSYNHFNYSPIPPQVRNLSRLTYLNLSGSSFSGQIPFEISQLSHLSSLDLSDNTYPFLELRPSLRSLVGNMTRLQKLDLTLVNISSSVPNILANLSSLTFLSLSDCGGLHGEFPIGIFKLSNLRYLNVGGNKGLTGHLPSFTWSSPLEILEITGTNFSGELPASMGNLGFLNKLFLWGCNFSGSIPSSLGNLTKLTLLDFSENAFVGNIPPSLGPIPFELINLPQLTSVDLSNNLLSGEIHFGLKNNTQLASIVLSNNRLTGPVTFGPMNLTQLSNLDLSGNKLHGQISNSIFNLKNLEFLDLSKNYLDGIVEFVEFVKVPVLHSLDISGNQLSEFPNFLRNQHELEYLNLSNNEIHGQVPEWMWNTSSTSLQILDLSNNFLTGFGHHLIFLPWTRLQVLDLKSNLLQGSLPIPPVSTFIFSISNNSLTGNIPELFCNLSSLKVLDLGNNNLSDSLPQCLDNFGASLSVLDLRKNKFQGSIPDTWIRSQYLSIINFSQNKFQGHLSRSLAECTMLTVLDLSDNQFNDKFPFWLGHLPNFEVLILRSNKFNGPMETPQTYFKFPNMRILDISNNDLMGKLPLGLLENWKAIKFENVASSTYIQEDLYLNIPKNSDWEYHQHQSTYTYSMTMTNKGNIMFYEKVQELFTAIDFSNNKFVGEIPKSIGNLKRVQLLNLSNNYLTGHIPSSLGNLTELETLDLSQNKLSGEIPQQLTQLTFLEVFNVSHNSLTGPIPQGKQFDTFDNNSFEDNPGLCGKPLTKKCGNSDKAPFQHSIIEASQDSGSPFEFGWKIVMIGYGFGFVVGVIIGPIVIARKHDWLMKTFRIRPPSRRRR
ncbi:receptor-like protein 6 [Alnus glutinosa]|uniref:receptor-like protein 6 n=1 Tax=Alnus glutinosa TaxID=3517 RepID=UPI002D7930F9|nr:receptor-like protein 6 [Alnus glutinosa]